MKKFATQTALLFVNIAGAVLSGWVLAHMWLWFVVSTFHVVALTVPEAIGVMGTIRFMFVRIKKIQPSPDAEKPFDLIAEAIVRKLIYPLVVLACAVCLTLFL